ncbi:MAG: helix-turn-helix transcriptional regulator [Clostridiales bacterium]|nr:helix-turn-helix transcriptional regulator [Clostridiales bacterium]
MKWEDYKTQVKEQSKEDELFVNCSEKVAELVAKLIKVRINKGISQRDLAAMTGIKQSAIARTESLNAIPRIDTLIKIAEVLHQRIELIDIKAEEISRLTKTFNIKFNVTYPTYNKNPYVFEEQLEYKGGVDSCKVLMQYLN